MKNLFLVICIAFFTFSSCKKEKASEDNIVMAASLSEKEMDYAVEADTTAVEAVSNDNYSPETADKITLQIIKTGDLRFETNDLEETYQKIQALVKKYKISIQNDSEGKESYSIYRNFVLRVPNQNFDAFIKEIATGVDYFDRKEITVTDVTEEYVDVNSRIKTKKALENRYLELLKKANKVSEMLEIEKELASIREEIEAKEGRLNYLKNRVAMSTITIEVYKNIETKGGATVSFGNKFVNAIKSGFNAISSFFIGLIKVWPFIIILVALIYFIKKRFKKKNQ